MAIISYPTIQDAHNRSAELWAGVRGPGWQPGNVTQYLYPRRERIGDPEADADLPDGVDYAIQIVNQDETLDGLIAAKTLEPREIGECAELYPTWEADAINGVEYSLNDLRSYDSSLYICIQPYVAYDPNFVPPLVPNLWNVYRKNADQTLPWVAGEQVKLDWHRIDAGIEYICKQPHVTQFHPVDTPALWNVYVDPNTPSEWVQPTGAQDAYALGAKVLHNGHLWESTVPDNVWEPGVFGWDDLGVYP